MNEEIVWFGSKKEEWSEIDPVLLANALDHIRKSAKASRSQTRRLRWIEKRAEIALEGREYHNADIDLPKKPIGETVEQLQKRYSWALKQVHFMREGLELIAGGEESAPVIASQYLLGLKAFEK